MYTIMTENTIYGQTKEGGEFTKKFEMDLSRMTDGNDDLVMGVCCSKLTDVQDTIYQSGV